MSTLLTSLLRNSRLAPPAPDRTAVVTGASSGIGAELARQLARRGYQVTLVARRAERLAELAAEITATGVRADILAADLSDPAARAGLLGRIDELGLTPSILVNCAGLATEPGPAWKADPAAELNMVEVDVAAVVDLCTRFLPGMVERRSGAVLNVGSTAGFQPIPASASYAASKAFVLSYTRALSEELRTKGVLISVLCPGPVATEFTGLMGLDDDAAKALLPSVMWVPVTEVAAAGIAGLESGTVVVIPGLANRVSALVGRFTPRRLVTAWTASRQPALFD